MSTPKDPLTPLQLQGYCREHMALFARQIADNPTEDPPPQMQIIYLPLDTATSAKSFRDPKNWQADMLVFATFDESRFKQMQEIGKNYANQGHTILCVCLATLAWRAAYSGATTSNEKNKRPKVMPSEHPNREEVAICWGQTLTSQQHCVTIPIHRDANGAATPGQREERTSQQAALLDHFFQAYATTYLNYLGHKSPTAPSHPLARINLN